MSGGLMNDVWCTVVELVSAAMCEQGGQVYEVDHVPGTAREWVFGGWNVVINVQRASEYRIPHGWADDRRRLERGAIVPAGALAMWLKGVFMGCVGPFDEIKGSGWEAVVAGLSDEIGVVQGVRRVR